jgi:hypothetical protein
MNELHNPEEGDSRRRKLDDLFADEPFLSPTMKARRLHEKLQEMQNKDAIDANGLPAAACVGEIPPMLSRTEMPEPIAVPTNEGAISLTAARRLYRQEKDGPVNGTPDRLSKLKDTLLSKWLDQAWPVG